MAKNDLSKLLAAFRKVREGMEKLEANLPRIVGKIAVDFVNDNFKNQSYNNNGSKIRWKKRSPATDKGYDKRRGVKGSVFSSSAPILEQTGNLRDGVKAKVTGRTVFIGFNENKLPYGRIHNEGGTIHIGAKRKIMFFNKGRFAVRRSAGAKPKLAKIGAHTIKMPRRQFMPTPSDAENTVITNAVLKKIQYERNRIMKPFLK